MIRVNVSGLSKYRCELGCVGGMGGLTETGDGGVESDDGWAAPEPR